MKYNPKIVLAYFAECGLPPVETEYRFAEDRKFRFDFAFPKQKVALEVEGGIWSGGAHGRGSGIRRDIEKYNLATKLGWAVLRCEPKTLCTNDTVELVRQTMLRTHIETPHKAEEM